MVSQCVEAQAGTSLVAGSMNGGIPSSEVAAADLFCHAGEASESMGVGAGNGIHTIIR